jgi:phenylpyruvate tautomerase
MPYVNFIMGNKISPEKADKLKSGAAEILERHTGKGENWLYVQVTGNETLYFQGRKVVNGGVVEVKLVGTLFAAQKRDITSELGLLLEREFFFAPDQVYIIFTEVKGEDWGWNGRTFG